MHCECLSICSGDDLLQRIPRGSTYISAAAARGWGVYLFWKLASQLEGTRNVKGIGPTASFRYNSVITSPLLKVVEHHGKPKGMYGISYKCIVPRKH